MFRVESIKKCSGGAIVHPPSPPSTEGNFETFNEAKKRLAEVVAKAIKEGDESLHRVYIYDEAGAMGHGPGALVYDWMRGWWPKGYGFV